MTHVKEELTDFLQEIHPHLLKSSAPRDTYTQESSMHLKVVAQTLTEAAEWAESHTTAGELYKVGVSTIICTSIFIVWSSATITNLLHVQHMLLIMYISKPTHVDNVYVSTLHRCFAHYGRECRTKAKRQWQCA